MCSVWSSSAGALEVIAVCNACFHAPLVCHFSKCNIFFFMRRSVQNLPPDTLSQSLSAQNHWAWLLMMLGRNVVLMRSFCCTECINFKTTTSKHYFLLQLLQMHVLLLLRQYAQSSFMKMNTKCRKTNDLIKYFWPQKSVENQNLNFHMKYFSFYLFYLIWHLFFCLIFIGQSWFI